MHTAAMAPDTSRLIEHGVYIVKLLQSSQKIMKRRVDPKEKFAASHTRQW
jgi:hypothetical protein